MVKDGHNKSILLGAAGAGGILVDPRGNIMFHYAWELGTMKNNITEAYDLYAGLKLTRERNTPQLSVFGDSMLIVWAFIKKNYMENNQVSGILQRITTLIWEFEEINLFHIKRGLNPHSDHWAKEGSRMQQGEINLNNGKGGLPIP
jgi:ribonuclease HI